MGVSDIFDDECICGRDITITIDGKKLLQVDKAEIRKVSEIHRVRSCFVSEDIAHIRKNIAYKIILEGIRFRKPFENCNFADLDYFTLSMEADGRKITFSGCMWDDFYAAANKRNFSEHISATALRMTAEDVQ